MNFVTTEKKSECDLTLFVACYNEQAAIRSTLETVVAALDEAGCTYDIVVVDDASRDDSVRLIREFIDQHPQVPLRLVVNGANQGLGANYAEAAFHGRGKYFRLVCGDNAEDQQSLVKVLKHIGQADMILSYHPQTPGRPLFRRVISKTFTFLVNLLGGYRIKYYNGLAVHLRYYVMRWHSNAHGFGFQADLITRLLDIGATYVEVPLIPHEREGGASNALTFRNLASVGHTLLEIFIRRVARVMYPQYMTRLKSGIRVIDSPAYAHAGSAEPSAATECAAAPN
jgi:glycosyltransferase involved in cell wall biosynthesis